MPLDNRRALSDLQHRPVVRVVFFGWDHPVCDRSLPGIDLLVVGSKWDLEVPGYL